MGERTKNKNEWIAQNLDRINLTVPKGHKQMIRDHAAAHDESLNGFTNRAINEAIARDQAHDALLGKAMALAVKLTAWGYDTTDQDAIRLLEAFSVLESVFPDIERDYLSQMSPKDYHRPTIRQLSRKPKLD